MAGTKGSGNPYSLNLSLDATLGKAIASLAMQSKQGKSMFCVSSIMAALHQQLIDYWNSQGLDGEATFNELFVRWSRKEAEMILEKQQKEKERFDKLKSAYLQLGCSEDDASGLAKSFPKSNPLTVIKARTWQLQTNLGVEKQESREDDENSEDYNSFYRAYNDAKRKPLISQSDVAKVEFELAELKAQGLDITKEEALLEALKLKLK